MQRNQQLDLAAWHLQQIATRYPAALNHLHDQLSHIAFPATRTTDTPTATTNTYSDPTPHLAAQREHINHRIDTIQTHKDKLITHINTLNKLIRDATQHLPLETPTPPTCTGGDPTTWGSVTCQRLVESYTRTDGTQGWRTSGLCETHRIAKHRWEQANK